MKVGRNKIAQHGHVFVVAEAGSNHDGSLDQAKCLIDIAAQAGANAIKFQLFRAEHLYLKEVGEIDTASGKIDFFKFLINHSIPSKWLLPLKIHSQKRKIELIFSPFDEFAVNQLCNLRISALKIASPEISHIPLLTHAAKKNLPIILSTGMSSLGEIEEALNCLFQKGAKDVSLLHCISSYPAPLEEANLLAIPLLYKIFRVPIGFSDHTQDPIQVPELATILGAAIIEKHFTLSRKMRGPDHVFALEPDELKAMVAAIRIAESMSSAERTKRLNQKKAKIILGREQKFVTFSEETLSRCDKRSILVIRPVAKGEKISRKNIRILRAEKNIRPGLHPRWWKTVLGSCSQRSITAPRGLLWDDLLLK